MKTHQTSEITEGDLERKPDFIYVEVNDIDSYNIVKVEYDE
jgi:hypothetical protein